MQRNLALTAIAALIALSPTVSTAEEIVTPDEIRSNYRMVQNGPCTDHESGQKGRCYLFVAGEGVYYMVMTQYGKPVLARKTIETGYVQVWPEVRAAGRPL